MHKLYREVQAFVKTLELPEISSERRVLLRNLVFYIRKRLETDQEVNLNFICTHNARRSQLCQVWAHTAACYFGLDQCRAFSGGTEVTAFHPHAIRALENCGFLITRSGKDSNPVYSVRFSREAGALQCFSKRYHDPVNGSAPFAAVMTCSEAEANCPYIPGATARFALPYEDPKKGDGTVWEVQTYAERNIQIAAEMFYLFSGVKK